MPSDIQVFVRFKEQSIFAGEEMQSIITFKNVASISDSTASDTKTWHPRGWTASGNAAEHPQGSSGSSSQTPRLAAINSYGARKTSKSGHRNTASLTVPLTGSSVSRSPLWTASPVTGSTSSRNHQRSVSITSLGSPNVGREAAPRAGFLSRSRPTMNHGRSLSLQVHHTRTDEEYNGHSTCKHVAFA